MKIFSSDEIRAIKQFTLREQGINERQFIENVGETLAYEIAALVAPERRLVVFAGPDLNGAYALTAARHLVRKGYKPTVYLFNVGGNKLSPDCGATKDMFVEEHGASLLTEISGLQFSMPDLGGDVTVVDGIFGTERIKPISGGYMSIIQYINEMKPQVISIEVPSGLLVDSVDGMINRNIIHADLTLALGVPRVAFFIKENAELFGKWKIVPVEYSKTALDRAPWKFRLIERSDMRHLISPRDPFATKADCGHAVIFAGSYGMLGAAVLAANGALRGGVGKVTVHAPRCGFYVLQTSVPCAMFESDQGDIAITDIELTRNYNSVALGPGIGTADATIDALDAFLKLANANSRPLILDADALNCISIRPSMLNHIPVMSILTPHAGEFDRLFGKQPSTYARLLRAIDVARQRHIIIILKGRFTAIVRPDGKVYFNPSGSAALATPGSGDVLTGLLAAFLAQGMLPEFAALAAPYIHGLAGEMAAECRGMFGVTAMDVADNLGRAIDTVFSDTDSQFITHSPQY
ncbi:MAG: NAD(P)H-hydrate dehydratase [Muribaculaceae bacterium]|nr:NAD(P)H-hydrate dehydratase [Muribaculaceae bacterium]